MNDPVNYLEKASIDDDKEMLFALMNKISVVFINLGFGSENYYVSDESCLRAVLA